MEGLGKYKIEIRSLKTGSEIIVNKGDRIKQRSVKREKVNRVYRKL